MRNAAKEHIRDFEPISEVMLFPDEMKIPKYKAYIMVAFGYKCNCGCGCELYTHFKKCLISKN